MKKASGLLVAVMVAASLIAGCSSGGNSPSQEQPSTLKDGKYDPPITITIAKQLDENAGKYLEGESLNDNVLTRWGAENLGIKIETTLLGGDAGQYNNKLRLALTGSEKLPDVIPVYDTMLANDLIQSGRVREITEDIKTYMPERLKDIYKEYPTTFNPVVQDGKVYGMAIAPNLTEGEVMLIRQDWLDNLNLKAPTTIEEFERVIAAFTNDDPDRNGAKDTYGFTFSGKDSYNTGWVSDPVMIFSAYTGKHIPRHWYEEEGSGKIVYGSVHEGNKEALAKLRDWYSQGYLNKELATKGAWDAIADFTEGKAGIIVGRPWLYGSVMDVEKNISGAKVGVYPTINGVNGDKTYQSAQLNDGVFMFNKDFNNMEAFFLYYDKLYDAAFGTGDFKYGYAQGYDYDMVNGEVTFDPQKFNKPLEAVQGVGKMAFTKNTPSVDGPGKSFYDLANGAEPNTGVLIRANAADPTTKAGYVISYENREVLLPGAFNGPPTKTMQSSWEQLTTMEQETFTKIIYSEEPIEAFDDFVKQWHEKGGEQITEEVNEWYKNANEVDVMSNMGLK
ncbi:extracellular solute-binding protein [Paenibacillus nanensis]|uniref:Extracellular solute-binding protein n=1 Tax=Paenibacillus nanensis TaxID=393251 RepID=A0A3A1VGU1_9BACL|nr:extracellular solute-binding protein [Paenibacillus nanensis]RIX59524.1 extracellular solute-binding protein [Paenibacillus nanensis]